MKKILVTGAGGCASLAFTQCLNHYRTSESLMLFGTDCDPFNLVFSKTDKTFFVPPANASNYIKTLNAITKKYGIDFIHSQSDVEVKTISENRRSLKLKVFMPNNSTIRTCSNKYECYLIWHTNDVPCAQTILINNEDDVTKAFDFFANPLWLRAITGSGGQGSFLVHLFNHAVTWLEHFNGWGKFMASEYLPGANFGCDLIFDEGKLIASHVKERLAYALAKASLSGITGTASVVKSASHKESKEALDTALKAVLVVDSKPHGVFSVDLKVNKEARMCVTEINAGRFLTSSLVLFHKANIPLPYIYVKTAFNEKVNLPIHHRTSKMLLRSLDSEPVLLDVAAVSLLVDEREKKGWTELT